jgi:neutral ceramidase
MRLITVIATMLAATFVSSSDAGGYRIGIGKADITGPTAEVVMMGYADPAQKSAGLLNRLYARAFALQDTETNGRVIFVNCDLQAVFQLVHQEVIKQVKEKYGGLYSEQNLVLHATHTHAGPGGSSAYFMYDVSILGYINENFEMIVKGIVQAITQAHESLAPGSIRFNKGVIQNGGKNRSPSAYEANPAEEKAKYNGNRDVDMRMLHFLDSKNKLIGLLAFYPVHPTSLTQHNKLISGDNKGYAEFLVEEKYKGVVAAFGISNAADVSPNLIGNGNGTFRGEGKTDVESAEIMGKRQAYKAFELLDASTEVIQGSIVGKLSYVNFSNVTLRGKSATPENPYAYRTCPSMTGQNFAAGTEDGRGLPFFDEGSFKANPLFQFVSGVLHKAPEWLKHCHTSAKIPLLVGGLMKPVPWTPEILPVQVVKIGQFGFGTVALEVSTMAGRRIRETLRTALNGSVTEVEVVSITNGYAQYLTTKEEYSTQNYEGASTLFGPNQLEAVQQELTRVAASVVNPCKALELGELPRQFDRSKLVNFQTGVVVDTAPIGKKFGYVREDAKSNYPVGSVVSVIFAGGHPKNKLQEVTSFCDVEKQVNGKFETILTDSHWDLRYRWTRKGVSESSNTCEWYVREGNPTSVAGRYRLRHRGFHKTLTGKISPYEGTSAIFEISAKKST